MSTKREVVLAAISLLTAFAVGRWSAPERVKVETKVVEVEKKDSSSAQAGDKDTETHIIEHPDGTKETIITTHENWQKNHSSTDDTSVSSDASKEVTARKSLVTISALGGAEASNNFPLVYGVSVTKSILGPVTVGIWGLSDKTFGASLGLTF